VDIYAPIDIRDGRCVQLVQGDFDRETVFFDDPVEAAERWLDEDADWLHVVDLDGARKGTSSNAAVVAKVVAVATDTPVQVAGGIRSDDDIARVIEQGATRVVLGTAAVREPEFVACAAAKYPGRIAVAVDGRQGRAATDGWATASELTVQAVAERAVDDGAAAIIYTDVVVEGMLKGPNIDGTRELVDQFGDRVPVIASGGVASLEDVTRLRDGGAAGVIIGSALYRGEFSLADAMQAARVAS
jgi:phosphoribosylformimino-5-aminoimidazole carboxamide ribotide isomerase